MRDKQKQKEAARRHYLLNREAMMLRSRKFSDANRAMLKTYVIEAKSRPCADCGNSFHHCVMDFDHLNDKLENVADMVKKSVGIKKLKTEMDKCEVVCANCHRLRTWKRRQQGLVSSSKKDSSQIELGL